MKENNIIIYNNDDGERSIIIALAGKGNCIVKNGVYSCMFLDPITENCSRISSRANIFLECVNENTEEKFIFRDITNKL